MHFTETVMDAPTQKAGRLLGESPDASMQILTTEGIYALGDNLYATRCSIRYFNCVTAYAYIPDMVQLNWTRFFGCIALCSLLAGCFGICISLLYRRNKSLEQQLRRSIAKDKLRVFYQPIVHLATRRIVGAEALVRWTDEEGQSVGPDVFVKIAEERGFVAEITKNVVRRALHDFATTLRNHPDFRLSINVAATDLSDPGFLPMLEQSLERAKVSAPSLAIEITESSTARQEVASETIGRLRRQGHSVHIDDFGTGYSSLAYLHKLSVDAIKIDKSFTQAIGTESVVVAILPQILGMAEALSLEVIVEGVETELHASFFSTYNQPILAQGWLFGRPVPVVEFQRLLAENAKRTAACAAPAIPAPSPQPVPVELVLAIDEVMQKNESQPIQNQDACVV